MKFNFTPFNTIKFDNRNNVVFEKIGKVELSTKYEKRVI